MLVLCRRKCSNFSTLNAIQHVFRYQFNTLQKELGPIVVGIYPFLVFQILLSKVYILLDLTQFNPYIHAYIRLLFCTAQDSFTSTLYTSCFIVQILSIFRKFYASEIWQMLPVQTKAYHWRIFILNHIENGISINSLLMAVQFNVLISRQHELHYGSIMLSTLCLFSIHVRNKP